MTANFQETSPVTLLGTGLMGEPMARRLLSVGFPVTVWNRTPRKTRGLAESGARVAATPAEAAMGSKIVITMLADGAAVTEVFDQMAGVLAKDATVIDMSSISPRLARDHAARWAAQDVGYLDSPVSGG